MTLSRERVLWGYIDVDLRNGTGEWVSECIAAQIRGQVFQLRKFQELNRHQLEEHIKILEGLLKDLEASRSKSSPLRFALSALMQSVERGREGVYRVLDAELFIWSMDELTKLTEP